MEPWYKVVTPRKEVREGRSFDPSEFAIALEQVVAGTAPEDYRDPRQFFNRTSFTRALREHLGMALRRLAGETQNAAPVLALITQFGGGKTHTLTALYHLVRNAEPVRNHEGVRSVLEGAALAQIPRARVAVFVGNAWDPAEGKETPWVDLARQLAGDEGVAALGPDAKTKAPGTERLGKLFQVSGGRVLILCDEVLNFLSRHRDMAEAFRDFLGNLVRTMTGTTCGAAVVSLPQSKPEMSDWDLRWQGIIVKEVGRVAKQLISNDEAEIAEVVRRRLFEDLGSEPARKGVAKAFADWCFERRAQLPSEWTAVDTSATEAKAREFLRGRFEACYPFHPATLSVFQRKWAALAQYQQTRGTLAMFAQWISLAHREGYQKARKEPLLTLGSAPLNAPEFRAMVLGQLGEPRLQPAIETDIAGEQSHAKALDADTKGPLRDIHRRVGAAILFESSGGQTEKVAHLPELRFALSGPDVDTTSVDNAALSLEAKSFFLRKVGSDGFRIHHQATLKKVVNDRRASLDEDTEIKPAMQNVVLDEFRHGASVPIVYFPEDGDAVQDSPKLTLVVMAPEVEWPGSDELRQKLAEWTRRRGQSARLYPGSLVWSIKKSGREFRERVELWLAWKRVAKEIAEGMLGAEYDKADKAEIQAKLSDAEEAAKDEVWGGYRFVVLFAEASVPVQSFDHGRLGVLDEALRKKLFYDKERRVLGLREVLEDHEKQTLKEKMPELQPAIETLIKQADQGLFADGLRTIDLGAGHASAGETLCGRVVAALKSQALLNESIGAGYIERHWPPALKQSGAWPLSSLRQSFLNGALTRLLDPDSVLRGKVVEFVGHGDFGLASGQRPDGYYEHVWYAQIVSPDEVTFDAGVFLLTKAKAKDLTSAAPPKPEPKPGPEPEPQPRPEDETKPGEKGKTRTLHLVGMIPLEVWNRVGVKLLPKLKSGSGMKIGVDFSVTVNADLARSFETDLRQILADLNLTDKVRIEES